MGAIALPSPLQSQATQIPIPTPVRQDAVLMPMCSAFPGASIAAHPAAMVVFMPMAVTSGASSRSESSDTDRTVVSHTESESRMSKSAARRRRLQKAEYYAKIADECASLN